MSDIRNRLTANAEHFTKEQAVQMALEAGFNEQFSEFFLGRLHALVNLAAANAKVAEKVQQAFDRGLKAGNEQAQQQQMSIHEGLDKLQAAESKIADLTARLEKKGK